MGACKGYVVTAEPQTKIKDSDEDVVLDALRCLPWHPLSPINYFTTVFAQLFLTYLQMLLRQN